MIRIVLLGRTGNNMFQYAIGRVLAEKHDVPLVMDGSWFASDGWSQVSHFLNQPLKACVRRQPSIPSRILLKLTGKHYWEYAGVPVIRESDTDMSFDESVLSAPADCMLFGYFQSPLYFESIAGSLRQEFNEYLGSVRNVDSRMRETLSDPSSVAVHVRRTDYLNSPAFSVCGNNYYKQAMREISERVPGARFFVFSDDPKWCETEFGDFAEIVEGDVDSSRNPLHDMYLMSLASHHIIANSTYSWWAAWMAESSDQQVMMPDCWQTGDVIVPVSEKKLPHWTIVPTGHS